MAMRCSFAIFSSYAEAMVESWARIGGRAGGLSWRDSARPAVALLQVAALLRGTGRGLYARRGTVGDGAGGHGSQCEMGPRADPDWLLWRASAGAFPRPPFSLWRRDPPPRISFGEDQLFRADGAGDAYFLRWRRHRLGI